MHGVCDPLSLDVGAGDDRLEVTPIWAMVARPGCPGGPSVGVVGGLGRQ